MLSLLSRLIALFACAWLLASCAEGSECNGHAELCGRRFNQVAFPGTHNSMSARDAGFLAPNQEFGIAQQLRDGVRVMLLDTHSWQGEPYLCHSLCEAGATPLIEAFEQIRQFMDQNPREVLTFIIQDNLSAEETEAAFVESGLIDLVFVHSPGKAWPTLGRLIRSDRRLLVTAEGGGPPPAWYQHAWDLMSDTPYSFTTSDEFSCSLNRGEAEHQLLLMNHWLGTPLASAENADVANAFDTLNDRAFDCWGERSKIPNFVAVDFYDRGALFEVVDGLNRVNRPAH